MLEDLDHRVSSQIQQNLPGSSTPALCLALGWPNLTMSTLISDVQRWGQGEHIARKKTTQPHVPVNKSASKVKIPN
jgi:hypothetical protein